MSSSTPYIGSTISLVSKAKIRYVGTLYSIDTVESTVTLANVRSFGTEDRKVDVVIPPRTEVYEYIVFRGKDIDDLHVCPPPDIPKSTPQPPQDPAIVQAQSATVSGPGGYSPYRHAPFQGGYSPFSGLPSHPYYPMQQPPTYQDRQLQGVMAQMPSSIAPGTPLMPRIPTPPMPQHLGLSRTSTPSPELRMSPAPELKTEGTQTKSTSQQAAQPSQAKKKSSARKGSVDKTHEKENKKPELDNKDIKTEESTKEQPPRKPASEPRSRGNNRRPQGRRGGSRGPRQETKFEGEYDFESANAKFKKDEIEEELQKQLRVGLVLNDEVEVEGEESTAQSPTPETFYDKTSSFFDSISCEAKDRDRNRKAHPSWQEERKLNTETFGVGGMRRGGRGYYRGRGGRGGYRGRGGGRGYYRGRGRGGGRGGRGSSRGGGPNRDWVDYPLDNDTSKLQQNLPNGPAVVHGPPVDQPVQA